jgi:hypothetical protein
MFGYIRQVRCKHLIDKPAIDTKRYARRRKLVGLKDLSIVNLNTDAVV